MEDGIRLATKNDHAALSRIAGESLAMHAQALPDRFRADADPLPVDYAHALIDSDDAAILVAERGETIAGYAILKIRESPAIAIIAPRKYVLLNDLLVYEAVRGQGIGRELVDACVEWACEQGASALKLGVFECNESAIAFYEHLGFKTTKRDMSLPLK